MLASLTGYAVAGLGSSNIKETIAAGELTVVEIGHNAHAPPNPAVATTNGVSRPSGHMSSEDSTAAIRFSLEQRRIC